MTEPEGKEFTKAQALSFLREHYDLGRHIRDLERLRDTLGAELKGYLHQTGECLEDEERSLVARLQERQGADEWDLTRAPGDLIGFAAQHGLLKLDNKLFQSLQGKFIEVDVLKRYRMPGKPSTALIVQRKEA